MLLFFMLSTLSTKSSLHILHAENGVLKSRIGTIMALKREYGDPTKKKRDFQRLLQNRTVKASVASQTLTNAKGGVTLEGVGEAGAKWFVQKLFNDKFRIKKLEITRGKEALLTITAEVLF